MPRYTAPIHPPRVQRVWPDAARPLPQAVQDYVQQGAAPGERNARLYKAAQQFHACGYTVGEAESWLTPRAIADGLPKSEVRTTIQSAYRSTQVTQPLGLQRSGTHASRNASEVWSTGFSRNAGTDPRQIPAEAGAPNPTPHAPSPPAHQPSVHQPTSINPPSLNPQPSPINLPATSCAPSTPPLTRMTSSPWWTAPRVRMASGSPVPPP